MLKIFFNLFLVAIALFSVIILITSKTLNSLILLTTLSINVISLFLMIFHIQSIGSNIYTFSLIFIFINNIFLSLFRFIISNLAFKNRIKDFLVKFLSNYIKIFIFKKLKVCYRNNSELMCS